MKTRLFSAPLSILLLAGLCGAAAAQSRPTDEELFTGADARIEQHRKADATVTVLDAAGQAVAGAELRVEQTRHAFLFGCNIFRWGRVGEPEDEAEYRRRYAEVFNFATLPFYWWSYEARQGQPIHDRTTEVARWCRQQGIVCKGHPLAWNYHEPRWLPDDADRVRTLQMDRIEDCVGRFQGQIDVWDVVNEATHFERPELKQRAPKLTGLWADMGRVEFTRACFRHARQVNPSATLLINDYRVDRPYEHLVASLVDDQGQRLYDVIGIQSHQHGGTWTNRKIWDVCQRFARFGVPLHFTETTILSGKRGWELAGPGRTWDTTPEGEAYQAREVERFYTMLYSHPAVEALTWWDFSDRGAWQRAPAGLLRADMSRKPAYDALNRLINEKWRTKTTVTTNERGQAKFRGTCGAYRITVRSGRTPPVPVDATVERAGRNEFVVRLP